MPRMLPVLLALGVLAVGCGGEDDADELPPHTTIGADFIPDVTDADVERIVRRDYTDTQLEDVGQVLAAYGTENCEPDGNARGRARVRLAALKLAAGDLDRLRSEIALACLDFRDVLAPAESPGFMTLIRETGSLPDQDELSRVEAADWEQYQTWLHSSTSNP